MEIKSTTFNYKNWARLLVLVALLATTNQCKNDLNVKPENQSYLKPISVKDQLSVKMAKILAQKMTNQSTRDFIKSNALKKFDEDYNFLFADSYNFLLDKGKDADFIDSVLRYHPLMQIVVPELLTVKPESWNTATHIPLVAVVPELHQPGKDTLIGGYDAEGKLYMISTVRDPTQHIVLISENVRTEFYSSGQEPSFDKIKKHSASNKRCDQMLRISNPDRITSTKKGNYYLRKEIAGFNNAVASTCGGGGGGGGGSTSTPTCYRAGLPLDGRDVIGDMSYQNMDVLRAVADFTGSAMDFKMDIDYGGINGSPVKNFAVYFYVSRHTSSSCDFFFWCWSTQFNPAVPTLSWDRVNDGNQMLYTLWALGNGQTTTTSSTYTATGDNGLSLTYNVSKSITSKDKILSSDYVKYCDTVLGQGTKYGVNQLAYFFIHR
jgi:hypothetical protein